MTQPWEQLPDESPQAYNAFITYRDIGPTRSLQKAWAQHRLSQGKKPPHTNTPGTWTNWAQKHHWADRAKAFDNHIAAARATQIEEDAKERAQQLHDAEWALGQALIQKAQEIIRLPTTRQTITRTIEAEDGSTIEQYITIEPVRWTMGDAVRLAEMGSRLSRRGVNVPIEATTTNVDGTAADAALLFGINVIAPAGVDPADADDELLN